MIAGGIGETGYFMEKQKNKILSLSNHVNLIEWERGKNSKIAPLYRPFLKIFPILKIESLKALKSGFFAFAFGSSVYERIMHRFIIILQIFHFHNICKSVNF